MNEINVGLAGVGYWGSKLARNLHSAPGCKLAAISDPDPARAADTVHQYPEARSMGSLEDLIAADDIEAVVLATPASLHAEHAIAALQAGKHVFVEKPLALSVPDAEAVIAAAEAAGRTLMVGHTFLYSEPVRMLRRLISEGQLGNVLYVYGSRLNLGVIREDLNALWNFAPHDVAILLYLLGEMPTRVSARQFPVLNRRLEDVAFVVLEFPSGVVGHLHTSWLDPRKKREFTVVGDEKMVVYDDTSVETPVQVYDKGVAPLPLEPGATVPAGNGRDEDFGEFRLKIRAGDILSPRVAAREPLRTEMEHFIECVRTGATPLTDGRHGRDVVAILAAAEASSALDGAAVTVGDRGGPERMTVPLLDLHAQHAALAPEINEAIQRVLAHGRFINGPEVAAFEHGWARYCEVPHAVGSSSGTSALTLALKAAGVGPGDEVITTAFTFIATVESIVEAGATPVLVDCEPDSGLMTPGATARRVTPDTARS